MKWVTMGAYEVVADAHGKIIAHIQVGSPAAPLQPMDAVIRGKSIGKYISVKTAKAAIERSLNIDNKDDSLVDALVDRFRRMRENG